LCCADDITHLRDVNLFLTSLRYYQLYRVSKAPLKHRDDLEIISTQATREVQTEGFELFHDARDSHRENIIPGGTRKIAHSFDQGGEVGLAAIGVVSI